MPTRDVIARTQAELQRVCDAVYHTLAALPQSTLEEMVHECEDVERRAGGKQKLAAEIVRTEAITILDQRKGV